MARILTQVLLLCVLVNSQQQRYCNLSSCRGVPHTLCLYPTRSMASSCRQLSRRGLTRSEEMAILDKHNRYRAFVASGQERRGNPGPQPAARNLRPLKWSKEIAEIAQRWANQCDYGHDRCRNTARNVYVGQNIAWIGWTDRWSNNSIFEMIDTWYNEVAQVNRTLVTNFNLPSGPSTPIIGHYTQMVWANTHFLGCGVSRYRKDLYYITYLVCNYGPGGNYAGQQIYQIR